MKRWLLWLRDLFVFPPEGRTTARLRSDDDQNWWITHEIANPTAKANENPAAPEMKHNPADVFAMEDLESPDTHNATVEEPEVLISDEDLAELLPTSSIEEKDTETLRFEAIEIPREIRMKDDEWAVAVDWMQVHRTIHALPRMEISGQYWVRYGISSIGLTTSIGCTTCGAVKILTEISTLQTGAKA